MPGLNGTGPMGQGSMTGRGIGNCNPNQSNFDSSNNTNYGVGRGGYPRGCGKGRVFGGGRRDNGVGVGRGRNFFAANQNQSLVTNNSLAEENAELKAKIAELEKQND